MNLERQSSSKFGCIVPPSEFVEKTALNVSLPSRLLVARRECIDIMKGNDYTTFVMKGVVLHMHGSPQTIAMPMKGTSKCLKK